MSEAPMTAAATVCPAEEVIRSLRSKGFTLSVEGGRLVVRPASRLTPDEQASLHRNAHQIIATLKQNVENVKNVETSTAPDPIASHAADALFAEVLARVDQLQQRRPASDQLAAILRETFERLYRQGELVLSEARQTVENCLANTASAARPQTTEALPGCDPGSA